MEVETKISILFLLGIPGVLCKDGYDVGGMVAASTAGLVFLVAAILTGVFLCFWPDYYHRQQLLRGKVRVIRKKRKWRWWSSKKSTTTTAVTHPRSEFKQNMVRMYEIDGAHMGSPSSTLQGRVRAETWMQKLPNDTHETKSKTITLEQEEEPVIVADLLRQGTTEPIETTRTYTYTDVSQSRKPDQTQYVTTEVGPSQYSVSDGNVIRYTTSEPSQVQYTTTTEQDTREPIHVKMETQGYTGEVRELRTTQLRSTHSQPVHVQSGQSEDIIISPMIPSDSQDYQGRPVTYQYQTTGYQIRQTDSHDRHPTPQGRQDEAVAQFGDGEIQNY